MISDKGAEKLIRIGVEEALNKETPRKPDQIIKDEGLELPSKEKHYEIAYKVVESNPGKVFELVAGSNFDLLDYFTGQCLRRNSSLSPKTCRQLVAEAALSFFVSKCLEASYSTGFAEVEWDKNRIHIVEEYVPDLKKWFNNGGKNK